jgi:hypothetical protein
LIPGRDNHWLDCCVGSAVAASFTGISAVGVDARPGVVASRTVSREEAAKRRAEIMAKMRR